jgi:hypothetical protein
MKHKPFIGLPREEWQNWVCGFLEYPDAIHCNQDVKWHGLGMDPDGGERVAIGMSCCDEHLPQMKFSADWIHQHRHPCGVPESWFRWPGNECYLEWDETELLTQAAAEPVSV